MNGFGILMLIFGILIILCGLYIYCGHNSELLLWKGYNKKATKSDLKYIGKITMIIGIVPIISSISSLFFDEDSIIPIVIMGGFLIINIIICTRIKK